MLYHLVAWLLLVLGLSYLLQAQTWLQLIHDTAERPQRMLALAFIVLLLGLSIVLQHNVWVWDWNVVITVLGWVMVVKGVVYLLYPQMVRYFISWSWLACWARVNGVVMVVLAVMMLIAGR